MENFEEGFSISDGVVKHQYKTQEQLEEQKNEWIQENKEFIVVIQKDKYSKKHEICIYLFTIVLEIVHTIICKSIVKRRIEYEKNNKFNVSCNNDYINNKQ